MPDSARAAMRALVDGEPADAQWLTERGFQFGDGLFETIAVIDGGACLWDAHLARLVEGCRRLDLPVPDAVRLRDWAETLCAGRRRAVLKVYWTAGRSGRGYRRPDTLQPRCDMILTTGFDLPDAWTVRACSHRLGRNPTLAQIKHLNRLDQVIARAEWSDPKIDEGLMLSQDGELICGTRSNLFVQAGSDLLTPVIEAEGVRGVIRQLVLQAATRAGQAVREQKLWLEDLYDADAVFMTNSIVGVVPVLRVGNQSLATSERWPAALALASRECHQPSWRGLAGA